MFLWDPPQEFVYYVLVCNKCAPSIPVTRLIGRSGFVNYVGYIKATSGVDTQEITSLISCLMWNDASVCERRVWLNIFVRIWYDMWKNFERESTMILSVPLMCCDYMDVSFLTRVQPSHKDKSLCDSDFTGSNYALCIQPSALEMSMNDKMC